LVADFSCILQRFDCAEVKGNQAHSNQPSGFQMRSALPPETDRPDLHEILLNTIDSVQGRFVPEPDERRTLLHL
jgi:hypothetical protein